jgi:uncharacterized repeat protein (TIGR01451 family)
VKRNYNGKFDSPFPAGINVTVTGGGSVAWSSTLGVRAVIVKGASHANIYRYNPPDLSEDSGLKAPAPGTLSNLTFCHLPVPPPPPPPPPPDEETPPSQEAVPPVVEPEPIIRTRAVLRVSKTAPRRVRAGQRFVYTIRVRNTSPTVARNVTLRDLLPPGLVLVRAAPSAQVRGRALNVRLGNLRSGQTRIIRVTVRSAAGACGVRTNVAVANATNANLVRARARTILVCAPARVIIPKVTG